MISRKLSIDRRECMSGVRIARIATTPSFVFTQLRDQIEAIALCGAKISVITSDGIDVPDLINIKGVEYSHIDIARKISPIRDLRALCALYHLFKENNFDIVHSTTPKAGLLTAIASFIACVPVRLHTFTGQPWVCMTGVKYFLSKCSDGLIGLLNTHCYADSKSQMEFLVSHKIITENYISVIGDGSLAGVNVKKFSNHEIDFELNNAIRAELKIPFNALTILFLGRVTADKGIRELMDAFASIEKNFSNVYLLIVGSIDSDSGVGEVFNLRDNLKGKFRVRHIEHTRQPWQYMALSDILCLPSYREGFGTVVIEAASMGIPCVGTHIYGLTDAIEDGKTGILVEPRNAKALEIGLVKLLSDHRLRIEMGHNARSRAIKLYRNKKFNRRIIEEYLKFIKRINKF